jgi:hypothetical protein
MPRERPDRFTPDLLPDHPDACAAETTRLTSLGARLLARTPAHTLFADPDGNEFRLLARAE